MGGDTPLPHPPPARRCILDSYENTDFLGQNTDF